MKLDVDEILKIKNTRMFFFKKSSKKREKKDGKAPHERAGLRHHGGWRPFVSSAGVPYLSLALLCNACAICVAILGVHAASGAAWLDSSAAQLKYCCVNTGRNTTGSIGAFQPAFTQDHYDGSGITWPALW
jgi:hypothetical protein